MFFVFLNLGCNAVIVTRGVELTSPNYPDPYPPDTICQQKILFEANQKVRLVFKEFGLEYDSKCGYV